MSSNQSDLNLLSSVRASGDITLASSPGQSINLQSTLLEVGQGKSIDIAAGADLFVSDSSLIATSLLGDGGKIDLSGQSVYVNNSELKTSGLTTGGQITISAGNASGNSLIINDSNIIADPPGLGGLMTLLGNQIEVTGESLLNIFGTSGGNLTIGNLNTQYILLGSGVGIDYGPGATFSLIVGPGGTIVNQSAFLQFLTAVSQQPQSDVSLSYPDLLQQNDSILSSLGQEQFEEYLDFLQNTLIAELGEEEPLLVEIRINESLFALGLEDLFENRVALSTRDEDLIVSLESQASRWELFSSDPRFEDLLSPIVRLGDILDAADSIDSESNQTSISNRIVDEINKQLSDFYAPDSEDNVSILFEKTKFESVFSDALVSVERLLDLMQRRENEAAELFGLPTTVSSEITASAVLKNLGDSETRRVKAIKEILPNIKPPDGSPLSSELTTLQNLLRKVITSIRAEP